MQARYLISYYLSVVVSLGVEYYFDLFYFTAKSEQGGAFYSGCWIF